MSKRKRKRREGPLPLASAALIRFFEEETEGIKLRPELVVISVVALIILCIIAHLL